MNGDTSCPKCGEQPRMLQCEGGIFQIEQVKTTDSKKYAWTMSCASNQ